MRGGNDKWEKILMTHTGSNEPKQVVSTELKLGFSKERVLQKRIFFERRNKPHIKCPFGLENNIIIFPLFTLPRAILPTRTRIKIDETIKDEHIDTLVFNFICLVTKRVNC